MLGRARAGSVAGLTVLIMLGVIAAALSGETAGAA